jgi:hypothetical protein
MMSAVQNTMSGGGAGASQSQPPSDGRHEMKGPGLDISSLMGNIMMPPMPPMNTMQQQPRPDPIEDDDDDISDIVSEAPEEEEEIKEVKVTPAKGKRGPRKKKVEINL